MPPIAPSTLARAVQFLQVAHLGAALSTREDLLRWLAIEVRPLLPHDAILVASAEGRRGRELQVEFAQTLESLPVPLLACARRQDLASNTGLVPLANSLRDCWAAARYAPCHVDLQSAAVTAFPEGLRHALVHGTCDRGRHGERVIALLASRTSFTDPDGQVLHLLAPFIDVALRRAGAASAMAPPGPHPPPNTPAAPASAGGIALSDRERQIMTWVAMGKTNPEIGCILCISEFTVKNHLKSIFTKLDVTNRAQAVAKLTRLTVHA
jgi:transcriptional regulator EpsA